MLFVCMCTTTKIVHMEYVLLLLQTIASTITSASTSDILIVSTFLGGVGGGGGVGFSHFRIESLSTNIAVIDHVHLLYYVFSIFTDYYAHIIIILAIKISHSLYTQQTHRCMCCCAHAHLGIITSCIGKRNLLCFASHYAQ